MLINMSLKDFGELLASKEPAPGGGSVAALAGMMGASLAMMVINLSVGKKSYEALDENIKKEMAESLGKLEAAKARLAALVDEDTDAFNEFMYAVKLPKTTDAEKETREKEMLKAQERTIAVPFETCKKCLEVLQAGIVVSEHGNKNAASDAGVSALFAYAGLEGAVLNVKINLPGIPDGEKKAALEAEICKIQNMGAEIKERILKTVTTRIG